MNILIIRLGSLGDVILTTSIPSMLKERFPDAKIDFLVKKEFAAVLKNNPSINNIISLDSRGENKGISGLVKMARMLRQNRYSDIIDLHSNLRSRMLSLLLFAVRTSRYKKQVIRRRLLKLGFKMKTAHTVEAYTGALSRFNIPRKKEVPRLYPTEHESASAEGRLKSLGIDKNIKLIGFNSGAKWPTKMWPEENFAQLGKMITEGPDCRVIIFGGSDEEAMGRRLAEAIGPKAVSLAGQTSLRESAALIQRCHLFITNDSGPMHMATALGTPVIAIFGPTVEGFGFFPLGRSRVIEQDLPCRPCSLHGSRECPKGHFRCMRDISAEYILEVAKDELAKSLNSDAPPL